MKISVIIPLYNKEKFIKKTINSLTNQDYNNLEIIIVDDCSTDNSFEIVSNLIRNRSKIKLYKNSKNSGVSFSRNEGLSKATGEYILFLDADDYIIDSNFFKIIEKNIELSNPDFIFLQRNYYNKRLHPKNKIFKFNLNNISMSYYRVKMSDRFILKYNFPVGGSGSAIIKKKLLVNISFDEKLNHYEDWLFFTQVLFKSKVVTFYNHPAIYINYDINSLSKAFIKTNNPKISPYYTYLVNNNLKTLANRFYWINATGILRNENLANNTLGEIISAKLIIKNFTLSKHYLYSVFIFIKIKILRQSKD